MSPSRIIVITILCLLSYIISFVLLFAVSFEFMPNCRILPDGTERCVMPTINMAFGLVSALPVLFLCIPIFKWLTKIKIQ